MTDFLLASANTTLETFSTEDRFS